MMLDGVAWLPEGVAVVAQSRSARIGGLVQDAADLVGEPLDLVGYKAIGPVERVD